MNVTIKQLRAFATVARTLSFAESSVILCISQPALSICIKNLEDILGGKLLSRTTRSAVLTPEGKRFHPVVLSLLSDLDSSLEDVQNLFLLQKGKLEIAVMPTFANSLLPEILREFHQRHSNINIKVQDVVAESVVDLVRKGRVELGISFDPGPISELEFMPLFRDEFVVAFPQNHALSKQEKVSWKDLQNYPYLTLQRPSSIRLLIDRILREHGIELKPSVEAHQLATIGRMVTEGLGVSVVPSVTKKQMIEMGAKCLPLNNPSITRDVGILSRQGFPISSATAALLDIIKQTKLSP
tara:strand:- start:9752 stop:10645 length:894 start_codon:yes stop_codon:yes gene_type:complete